MRIFILIVFFSLYTLICLAQKDQKNAYRDSLTSILNGKYRDSIKAEAAFKLVDFFAETDSSTAVSLIKKARVWAKPYPKLIARSYWFEAAIYEERNYPLTEKLFMTADSLLSKYQDKKTYSLRSMIWHNFALIQQRKDDLRSVADILIYKALPLSKKTGNKVFIGTEYTSIGSIFFSLGQFEKALPYQKEGLKYLVDAAPENYYLLINAHLSLSESYFHLKNDQQAQHHLNMAKSVLNKTKGEKFDFYIARFWLDYYRNSTRLLTRTKHYQEAMVEAEKASELAIKLKDLYSSQDIILDKYAILFQQKKYSEAKSLLQTIKNEPKINSLTNKRYTIIQTMAEINFATGDYKEAYLWLKKSKLLGDSINESKLKTDINALEIKYQATENQQKIKNLNHERKQNALLLRNSKQNTFLLILASFFLLVIVILFFIYHRNYKKLAEQRAINYYQNIADLQQKQQLEISKAMLNAEEKERNRVARDLHDGLGGMLSGLKINLSSWAKTREMEFQDAELERIVKQLDGSVTELRHIARNMMPQTLLKFGLEVALKDLTESAMGNTIHIDFQPLNISGNIALEEQIIIYRIVQEILTNALKHAQATEIVLQCSENEKYFYITIEDDGVGFDTSNYKKGLGLENIKNRVAYLKGNFEIESQPQNGTSINIEIPISYV